MVCRLLSIYNPPFAAVIRASDFSRIAYLKFRALSHTHAQVPYVGTTFVSLDSIHHYQPPSSAFQPVQRRSASSKRRASTVSSTHKDYEAGAPKVALGVRFEDFDMTEYIDLTASPRQTFLIDPASQWWSVEARSPTSMVMSLVLRIDESSNNSF